MLRLKLIVSSLSVCLALSPLVALADSSSDAQDNLTNAVAQYQGAVQSDQQQVLQGQIDAANDRAIALLQSESFRTRMLNDQANGTALQQIASALADSLRAQGDANATNELMIAQDEVATMMAKADADVANAKAIGRADEIANAEAQWNDTHQLASVIQDQLVVVAMSSARLSAQAEANAAYTPGQANAQNSTALGANFLFLSDGAVQAGNSSAQNDVVIHDAAGSAQLQHAASSLASAKAQAAASQ